jgi:hypothetical protein
MAVVDAGIGGNRVLGETTSPARRRCAAVSAGINAWRVRAHASAAGLTHIIVLEASTTSATRGRRDAAPKT